MNRSCSFQPSVSGGSVLAETILRRQASIFECPPNRAVASGCLGGGAARPPILFSEGVKHLDNPSFALAQRTAAWTHAVGSLLSARRVQMRALGDRGADTEYRLRDP